MSLDICIVKHATMCLLYEVQDIRFGETTKVANHAKSILHEIDSGEGSILSDCHNVLEKEGAADEDVDKFVHLFKTPFSKLPKPRY
jgi:hypothetical protein